MQERPRTTLARMMKAILLLDKSLLEGCEKDTKERLAYCARDAHDLDEIKKNSQSIIGKKMVC